MIYRTCIAKLSAAMLFTMYDIPNLFSQVISSNVIHNEGYTDADGFPPVVYIGLHVFCVVSLIDKLLNKQWSYLALISIPGRPGSPGQSSFRSYVHRDRPSSVDHPGCWRHRCRSQRQDCRTGYPLGTHVTTRLLPQTEHDTDKTTHELE